MKKLIVFLGLAFLIAGGIQLAAQGSQLKGALLTDASSDESMIWLDHSDNLQLDRPIILEARDGSYSGVYEVRHSFDGNVVLKSPLREEYLAGSKVYQ